MFKAENVNCSKPGFQKIKLSGLALVHTCTGELFRGELSNLPVKCSQDAVHQLNHTDLDVLHQLRVVLLQAAQAALLARTFCAQSSDMSASAGCTSTNHSWALTCVMI